MPLTVLITVYLTLCAAVQALDRFDSRKHSGVIDNFRKNYIRTNIFSREFSDIIGSAFDVRL
jgi:uncharacterized protein (UPF0332 family)